LENRVKWALEVLGVEEGASMRKINAAYRKLARTYHPD
jgi:curved DNA-binding protein CbpA